MKDVTPRESISVLAKKYPTAYKKWQNSRQKTVSQSQIGNEKNKCYKESCHT